MSTLPPCAPAAAAIASTAARLSHDSISMIPVVPAAGSGRSVSPCQRSRVSSMKRIVSLHTMHAAVASPNRASTAKPIAR